MDVACLYCLCVGHASASDQDVEQVASFFYNLMELLYETF